MGFLAPVIAFLAANAPAITAAATLAGTGVTIGETLANQPGGPAQPATPQPTQPAQPATTQPSAAQQAAIQQEGSNVQAATGGSLAPASFSQMAASLTGNPGDAQTAQQVLFGGQGNQGLSDMLAQLSPPPAQSLTTPQGGG